MKNPLPEFRKALHKLLRKLDKIPARTIRIVSIVSSVIVIGVLAGTLIYVFGDSSNDDEPETVMEEITYEVHEDDKEKSYLNKDVLQAITDSGERVKNALDLRPATVDVPAEELAEYVTVEGCLIADSGNVEVSGIAENIPSSDDKYYYLFDEATYENEIAEDAEPIGRTYKDKEITLDAALNKGTADSRLFKKFIVAIKSDDKYITVSHASYITNPEAVASYNYGGMTQSSKKGLLVDPSRLSELDDLGVNYATYNIPLNRLLATSAAGSITYTYNGVTYYFNGSIIDEYDYIFRLLNAKGIDVAAIILNNVSPGNFPEITHPDARSGSTAPYYMFNGADESGVNALGAISTFLAGRYSGSGYGNVSMWIIGNEVNARKEWNYMAQTDISTYTAAYSRAFRVFYNGIKSVNSGANVYISIDQQWDRNLSGNPDYDGRDMLDIFASSIRDYGDIDWGLAQHPYSVPLDNTAFWNSTKYVSNSADSSFMTMQNINVLTDYMSQETMLSPDGGTRSIILSEVGYTSSAGDTLQAAAIAYAYSKVEANSKIDAIMFSRQTDAAEEIAQGLALGLCSVGGGHKYSYDVYKYMDTSQKEDYTAFAKSIVGVDF